MQQYPLPSFEHEPPDEGMPSFEHEPPADDCSSFEHEPPDEACTVTPVLLTDPDVLF